MTEKQIEKLDRTHEKTILLEQRVKTFEELHLKQMDDRVNNLELLLKELAKQTQDLKIVFEKKQAVQESWMKYGYPIVAAGASILINVLFNLNFEGIFSSLVLLI